MCNCNKTSCDSCSARYCGNDIPCLGIQNKDTYEHIVQVLADSVCSLNEQNLEKIDHVSFTSTTGGSQGETGETDTYTIWGDFDETINLGEFVVKNGPEGPQGPQGDPGTPGAPGGSLTWTEDYVDTGGQKDVLLTINEGKIIAQPTSATMRIYLPEICAVGDICEFTVIPGKPSSLINKENFNLIIVGWNTAGNPFALPVGSIDQTIVVGEFETTPLSGYLEYPTSLDELQFSSMRLLCIEANTRWTVLSVTAYDTSSGLPYVALPNIN